MDADPNKQALDAKQTFIFNLNFFCGLFIRVRVHSKLSTDLLFFKIAVTSFLVYTLRM